MYMDEMINIGKVENGYMISIRVPYKGDDDGLRCSHETKQFYVKTAEEVGSKVAEVLPKLRDKMDADEVFKTAFKEMADE